MPEPKREMGIFGFGGGPGVAGGRHLAEELGQAAKKNGPERFLTLRPVAFCGGGIGLGFYGC